MGANAGEPHNAKMQTEIVKEALKHIVEADMPGIIKPLPQVYHAKI
jgi:glycine reductase complex component B subunit gamma